MFAPGSSSLRLSSLPEQGRRRGVGEGRHTLFHPQSQGPADARGLFLFGEDYECGIAFSCDLSQPEADVTRHYRGTIEHYQREYATSQEKVGAPGRTLPFTGAYDHEPLSQ